MKQVIKITAIGFIVFALVANLHSSIFSFYGLKTNNLQGAVWANALSTTDGSSTGSGSGSSSSGAPWDSPIYHVVYCGPVYYNGSISNNGGATVTYTAPPTPYGSGSITVTYNNANSTSYSSSIGERVRQSKSCDGPDWALCFSVTAIEACNY
jgi:hypothetical protein